MTEPNDTHVSERSLKEALPVTPIDPSMRMRVQRKARGLYEGEKAAFEWTWQDRLVPITLLLAGFMYGIGAFERLIAIYG